MSFSQSKMAAQRQIKTVVGEVAAEMGLILKIAESHIASSQIEARLDELIQLSGEQKTYQRFESLRQARRQALRPLRSRSGSAVIDAREDAFDDHDFFHDDEPFTKRLAERKARIRTKIAFLLHVLAEDLPRRGWRRVG
jgi:hypothetical protein